LSSNDPPPLRDRFFAGHVRFEPEDATSLGVTGCEGRLSDPSERGAADELAFQRGVVAELDGLVPRTADERFDALAIGSYARFRVHALAELGLHRRCLEASLFPTSMLGQLAARAEGAEAWSHVADRLAALPSYLAALEASFGEGLRRGHVPSGELVRLFADTLLPGVVSHVTSLPEFAAARGAGPVLPSLRTAATEAAAAVARHRAHYHEVLAPRATGTFAIGREEYAHRLRCFFGMTESPEELAADAEVELGAANAALVRAADRLAAREGGRVSDAAGAALLLQRLWAEHPPTLDAVTALHQGALARIEAFVKARALYPWPEGAALGFCAVPDGMLHGGNVTNWPAPLRSKGGAALVAYVPRPEAHCQAGATCLFAHEGLPGHALQSLVWQRLFGGDASPVRFVAVCDDVAMVRQYFGPMLNVEGWAVRAEERLFEEGLFDDAEAVLAVASRGIRWARVVADIGLHTGRFDLDGATGWLAAATGLSAGWCRAQALRYARIPLQAITYALGAQGFARLRSERPEEPEAEFHGRVLAAGTAPPAYIAEIWRAEEERALRERPPGESAAQSGA
jgi:uncharacterized protein (DUF885 family)